MEGCAAGGARAVDLQWTGLEKLQGKQGLLTRRDLWTRTEAPVTALLGLDVRLQADNDWQGEQFAHIAARPAVCAMQLLTYGGVLQGGRGEYREQFLWTASAPQWVSPRVVSAQAESPHTMEAWGTHTLERGHRDN